MVVPCELIPIKALLTGGPLPVKNDEADLVWRDGYST